MNKKTYIGLKTKSLSLNDAHHITLVYTGEVSPQHEDEITELLNLVGDHAEFFGTRKGIELFGPNKDISVVTINPSIELASLQRVIARYIPSASEFPSWNPHVTFDVNNIHGDLKIPTTFKFTDLGFY